MQIMRLFSKPKLLTLALICMISVWSSGGNQQRNAQELPPRQSTTGPYPPAGVDTFGQEFPRAQALSAMLIPNAPAYLWYNGCGPTAVGMVLGYYAGHGFSRLFPGDANSQANYMNNAISSLENYADYCYPLDYKPNLLPDKSEPPFGDEHKDNCIADFMRTSQSHIQNYYGWSWDTDIEPAFGKYVALVSPYVCFAQRYSYDSFSFESLKSEINNGRPLVLLVDSDGDGATDHFVTVISFNSAAGIDYYGCYNTWDWSVHYYPYRTIAKGQAWGVYSVHTLLLLEAIYPPKDFSLQRVTSNFVFFKEYINRLNWKTDERNSSLPVRYRLYRKAQAAADETYERIGEFERTVLNYDDRGMKKNERYIYRITSVESMGRESDPMIISD